MSITSLFLQVGGEVFLDFEVPEQLDGLGGTQVVAEHDFPGGFRTQQLFGAFPAPVSWKGTFTGTASLARMRQVDRLRVAGQEVNLTYGDTFLTGVVSRFVARPRHQWLVPYDITFLPRFDANAVSPLDTALSGFALIMDALAQLTDIVSVLSSAGGSGPQFSAISNEQQFYVSLPPSLAPPINLMINDTFDALQAALGLPTEISFSNAQQIYADAQVVLAQATPLAASTDPTVASPALDVIGYTNTITASLATPSTSNVTTLYVTNPNIPRIAAQYYGNSSLWQTITNASNLPPDPLPVGQFTLVVPAVSHG